MPRYTKAVDIWTANPATLQPGQWVYAGNDEGPRSTTRGVFLGVKLTGSVVVAWSGNARAHRAHPEGVRGYLRSLRQYAIAR